MGRGTAVAPEESLAAAPGTDELRRRVAELEAENAELRRARRAVAEPEATRAALRESEAHAAAFAAERAAVLDQLAEGVIVTDAAGRIVFVNDAAARIHGAAALDVAPDAYSRTYGLHTEDGVPYPPAELPLARAVLHGETVTEARWRIRRPDGSEVLAAGSARPVRGPDGARAGAVLTLRDETARDAAERALRASEARLRVVFDQQFQFMAVLSPEGVTLEINGLPLRAAGLARDQVVGRPFWDTPFWAGLPAMREAWPGRLAEAARTDGPVLSEDQYQAAGGEVRTADAAVTAVRGPDGSVRFFVIQATDTTERKRAEAALRESEARFRNMADSAPALIWMTDTEGRVAFANMHHDHLFGRPALEMLGNGWRRVVHPDDLEGFSARFLDAFRARRPVRAEVRVRDKDGAVRWLRCEGVPRLSDAGAFLGYTGCNVDVSDAKLAEAALRESEGRLRALADNLPSGMVYQVAVRRDGSGRRFVYLARSCQRLTGVPAEAALADPGALYGAIAAEDRAGLAAAEEAAIRDLAPFEFEARLVRADTGEVRWCRIASAPREAPDGSLVWDGMLVDVTEKRAAEEAMRRLNETLEERVRERTRALEAEAAERERAEEQLRQAQKMEAVGQLTGGIAHDFNNLLTGIVGALAILQRRVAAGRTEGLERYTGAAITSAQRAAALTQRLLAFARRQPLDPKPVEANRLVAGMEDLLRRTLGPSIDLEVVLAGGLWPALCDPNQLESALLNLAINARDAMPEGGRLTVETANAHLDEAYARAHGGEVRPGQYVSVCVTDTGTGMAPEVAARAFEPFFTTKPLGQGTGLGLSMLYGFFKQSGGHVRIYSEVGQGTTFKLYLPRHRGSLEAAENTVEPAGTPRTDLAETVLVVEDEATVRMLVLETLEELGYKAVEAADGPSGLRVLQSEARVDLLVTDVGLPGLNGRQLADAARAVRPGLKVLFITGYAHNAAVGNGVLEPGTEMMTKPFAMDALADKIRSMIDKV
jgi:PAS domain S-box-containing protein